MAECMIIQEKSFKIYTTIIGRDQAYITASITDEHADPISTCKKIYPRIVEILTANEMQIVHERLFGSNSIQPDIVKARKEVLGNTEFNGNLPMTYIQGEPIWGPGLAGMQYRAVRLNQTKDNVWTIFDNGLPCGRGWKRSGLPNGTTFLMMQNMHGWRDGSENSRDQQTQRMFELINKLLLSQGASFQNVIRTWIYLSDILDWYGDFNVVRNGLYKKYGLIPESPEAKPEIRTPVAEDIYLPASTGIMGDNPFNASGIMDVLALVPGADSQVEVIQNTGVKQKSAFRYGSAFSRSMAIVEPDNTQVLVSGTAAIDEQGRSLFPGDVKAQIQHTLDVVAALVGEVEATLNDICDATVFLKRAEDIDAYREVIAERGLTNMPAVHTVADVCRDELLFELDSIVAVEKNK